ncbi:MAG TPA: cysteine desulfurase family protein [Rhizomicrobium sp.]
MALVYLDYAATTPLDPRVVAAMQPCWSETFGNPSSLHSAGREARAAVDLARERVAKLLNARPQEIIFTASGTEADNLALLGVVGALSAGSLHITVSGIEHPAVRATCRYLESRGVAVTYLPVRADGIVDPEALKRALRPETRLVSVMAANNVLGTIQPTAVLAAIAHEHGALFHTDAVQAAGRIPIDVREQDIDLLSLSAHKIHGPKGVGALFVRDSVRLAPLIHGGGQERGLRSATENVAGIVGLGAAADIANAQMAEDAAKSVALRDRIIDSVLSDFPNAYLFGHRYRRLPGHICLGFAGQEGEAMKLLLALDEAGIAVSAGSACSALSRSEPSYVLTALGFDPFRARGSIRITLGRFTTDADVDRLLEVLKREVSKMRPISTRAFTGGGVG